MKAGRMRRWIGRTPAEQPVEPAGEIVPWRKDPVAGYHAGGYLAHQRKAYAKRTAGPEHLSRHGSAVHRPEAQLFPAVFAGFACGLGTALSAVGTDLIVAVLMRMYGISNFSAHTALSAIVSPWGRDCTAVHRFCLPRLWKDQACAAYQTNCRRHRF